MPPKRARALSFDYKTADLKDLRKEYEGLQKRLEIKDAELEELRPKPLPSSQIRDSVQTRIADAEQRQHDALTHINAIIPEDLQNAILPLVAQLKEATQTAMDAKDELVEYERKRAARYRTRAKQLRGMRNAAIGTMKQAFESVADYSAQLADLRARVTDWHVPGSPTLRKEGEDCGRLKTEVEFARSRLSNFYDRLTTGLDPYDIDDYDNDNEDAEDFSGQKMLPEMEDYELFQIITRIEEQVNTVELQKGENKGKDQEIKTLQEYRQVLTNQLKQAKDEARNTQRKLEDFQRNPLYTAYNDVAEKEVIEIMDKYNSRKGQISKEEQKLLHICKAKIKEKDRVWRKYFEKKKEMQALTDRLEEYKASAGALQKELQDERIDLHECKEKAAQLEAQLAEQPAEQPAEKISSGRKKTQEVDDSQDKVQAAELEQQRRANLVAAQEELKKCLANSKVVRDSYQDFRDQVKVSSMLTTDEQTKTIVDLNKRVSDLDASKSKLTTANEEQKDVVDLNKKISVLTARNTQLEDQLNAAKSEINTLKTREQELKDQNKELSKHQPSLGNNLKEEAERALRKQPDKASNDQCKEEKERIDEFEKQLQKAQKKMRALQKELNGANARIRDLKKENSDHAEEISKLISGNEAFQLKETNRLRGENATLEGRLTDAEDERDDVNVQVEQLQGRIETLQFAISEFIRQGHDLEEVAKPLKGPLQQKLEEREKALTKCNRDSNALKKELDESTDELAEAARKLAMVQAGTPRKGKFDCKAERKKIRILRKRLIVLKEEEDALRGALESYGPIFKNRDKISDEEILEKLRASWKDHAALLSKISMDKTYNSKSVSSSSGEHSHSEGSGKDKPNSPSQLAAKQTQIDKLKKELGDCLKSKTENVGLEKELEEAKRSLELFRDHVQGLSKQLEEANKNIAAKKSPTKTQNKNLENEIARLEKELKDAQTELTKNRKVVTETIKREMDRRREAEAELDRAVDSRDAAIDRLQAELEEAETQRDSFEAERNEARDEYNTTDIETLKENLERIRAERDNLKKELYELRKNAKGGSSNGDNTELEEQIAKLKERHQEQRDEYAKIQDGLKDELEECEQQRLKYDHDKVKKKLEEDLKKCRDALKKKSGEHPTNDDELKKLRDERDEFEAQWEKFATERDQAREESNKLEANLGRIRAERNELKKQLKDKPNSPKQSAKEFQKLNDRNSKLAADLEKCRADSDKLREKANSLRQNLATDKQGTKAEVVALRKHRDAMRKEIVGPFKEEVAALVEHVAAAAGLEPADLLERAMDKYPVEPDNYPDEDVKDFRTREELAHMRSFVQQMGLEIYFLLHNDLIVYPENETAEQDVEVGVEGEDEGRDEGGGEAEGKSESKSKSKKNPEREGKPEDEKEPPVTQAAAPKKRKPTKHPDSVTPTAEEAKELANAGRGKRKRTKTERYSPTKYSLTKRRSTDAVEEEVEPTSSSGEGKPSSIYEPPRKRKSKKAAAGSPSPKK